MNYPEFYNQESLEFNLARLEHLHSLDLPVKNKHVIEYGAGVGLLTPFFLKHSCRVTAIEGRKENIEAFRKNLKDVEVKNFNVEEDNWESIPSADIGFAYGLLYHLSNPKRFIENMARKAKEFVILDTVVSTDGSDDSVNNVTEDSKAIIQSFTGMACRPTRQFVYRVFKENFPYVYIPLTQPKHPEFPLQFKQKMYHTMRFVIIGSNIPLQNSLLADSLVDFYTQ